MRFYDCFEINMFCMASVIIGSERKKWGLAYSQEMGFT